MPNDLREIVDKSIEQSLEECIKKIGTTESSVMYIGEFVEELYKTGQFALGESFRPALDILIPIIIKNIGFIEQDIDMESFIGALDFSGDFYSIRDYIHISFAVPGSVSFTGNENDIRISIEDPTIFRQLVCGRQEFILNSMSTNDNPLTLDELVSLLSGTKQFDLSDANVVKALESIESQAKWKIKHYFSHIPENSDIDMGGYSYREFFTIYKEILQLSLYERFYSKANNLSCVITYKNNELSTALEKHTGIDINRCEKIIRDIASSSRGTFNYISSQNKYYLFPCSFSLKDGINAILRQYAQRDSDAFSANCAGVIGTSLVNSVSSYFDKFKNFYVFTEILLQDYDKDLPDIDCLIISYEPSLGFHFFVCEVKNNLPASWAKEHLKARGKKGFIEKALIQSKKISDFLITDDGAELLRQKALQAFPNLDMDTLFPTGFCGVIDLLIVTSQSIGMFFPKITTTIISDDMLRHIVSRCDGDVNFIQHHLHHLHETLDKCYTLHEEILHISDVKITYPSCKLTGLIEIPQNEYLSNGTFANIEQESLKTGYSFINSIDLTQ